MDKCSPYEWGPLAIFVLHVCRKNVEYISVLSNLFVIKEDTLIL